jgi:hypothetical protein
MGHRQHGDLISLLFFFRIRKVGKTYLYEEIYDVDAKTTFIKYN